jgi:hypothetical protein
MEWLSSDHVGTPTEEHATIEGAVFSVRGPCRGVILKTFGATKQLIRVLLFNVEIELLELDTKLTDCI